MVSLPEAVVATLAATAALLFRPGLVHRLLGARRTAGLGARGLGLRGGRIDRSGFLGAGGGGLLRLHGGAFRSRGSFRLLGGLLLGLGSSALLGDLAFLLGALGGFLLGAETREFILAGLRGFAFLLLAIGLLGLRRGERLAPALDLGIGEASDPAAGLAPAAAHLRDNHPFALVLDRH